MEHQMKILLKPFNDLKSGRKTCEVRNFADREFREGDTVCLNLIDETSNPTGISMVRKITHIQYGFGLPDDVCVLSYAPAEDVRAVVEEPAFAYGSSKGYQPIPADCRHRGGDSLAPYDIPLYRHPQRPVVLPERMTGETASCMGYNACLDAVERLKNDHHSNSRGMGGRVLDRLRHGGFRILDFQGISR